MTKQKTAFQGLSASPGIALGHVHILDREKIVVPRRKISFKEIELQVARFDSALRNAQEQLKAIRKKMSEEQGDDHVYLIEAQVLMLDDPSFKEDARNLIREESINAEWAVAKSIERFKKLFDQIDDEYFRDRRSDIEYLEERLLRLLVGAQEQRYISIHRKTILVAHRLGPSDVVKCNRESLIGMATDLGGRTSHVSIIARSLALPMTVGMNNLSTEVQNGDRIIVDGSEGIVIVHPDTKTWGAYEEKRKQFVSNRKELLKNRQFKAETKDQYEIHLLANIDFIEEVPSVLSNGAEGIGMLRTENLFLGGKVPVREEEQFEKYRQIVAKMKPRETVIRLLDLAGDYLFRSPQGPKSQYNPALGLRGIRLLLREPEILKTQLRAILRASAFGKVAVLYPMVSTSSEIRQTNEILRLVMKELELENIPFDPEVRIGTMVEIPSAALTTNRLAQEVDFLSVGTNDLIQYTLGVDRANDLVAELYDPLHVSVLELLQRIVELGHKAGTEVGVCGEMASEPFFVPLLVALECNFLSVNANSIPTVKHIIRETNMAEAKEWLSQILELDDPKDVRKTLSLCYAKRFRGIFS